MAAFVMSIISIGIGRVLARASVCLFDCPLGQCETVVPPGRIPLAGFPQRDCNVGGPVNEDCNVGDSTKCFFFSAEVGEVHVGRLNVGGKSIPVCLVPGTS
jgi:hypothetical protein